MLVDDIKQNFSDDIIYAIEKSITSTDFSLESVSRTTPEKRQEVFQAVMRLHAQKETLKSCVLCHHTELVLDDWINDNLCLRCYNISNNVNRVEALLHGNY